MNSKHHGVRRHVAALVPGDMSPRMESADMSAHSKIPLRYMADINPSVDFSELDDDAEVTSFWRK